MLKVLSPEEMKIAMEQSIPNFLTDAKRKQYRITEEQEQNLRILLVGLERLEPTFKDIFNIECFADSGKGNDDMPDDYEARIATVEKPCGTPACAVGLAPSCGIAPIDPDEIWSEYSYRCFGGRNESYSNVNDFMFSWLWSNNNSENQMAETIARIKIVLAGKVPKSFIFEECYA